MVESQAPRKFVNATEVAAVAGGVIAEYKVDPINAAHHGMTALFRLFMTTPNR
jgi:hypothetical protein